MGYINNIRKYNKIYFCQKYTIFVWIGLIWRLYFALRFASFFFSCVLKTKFS